MNENLEALDLLTVLSFVLQLQNQGRIIDIRDIQRDNDRAVKEIHAHLESQDEKIGRILEALYENN